MTKDKCLYAKTLSDNLSFPLVRISIRLSHFRITINISGFVQLKPVEKQQRSKNIYFGQDNFFQELTKMESPRKNNDCYFYYYSTCTKGDNCTFRHEPSALGCETVCSFWKEGKCINVRCNFRHMELRKNRKAIACYWETQPGGCLKPHCPFMHENQKHVTEGPGETSDIKSQELKKDNAMKGNDKNFESPVVDPLVVNFEEESDNESAPTFSPIKSQRAVKVKTLEEIKLEKIQAESAAYYSYQDKRNEDLPEADDLRQRILSRFNSQQIDAKQDFAILSLKDIRKRKLNEQSTRNFAESKRQKISANNKPEDLSNVKIKTLSEIRAEKAKRLRDTEENPNVEDEEMEITSTNSEVTSTSLFDTANGSDNKIQHVAKVQPIKRSKHSDQAQLIKKIGERKPKLLRRNLNLDISNSSSETMKANDKQQEDLKDMEIESTNKNDSFVDDEDDDDDEEINLNETKLDELLEDEESEDNVTLKAEDDDILKDIDELLNG